MLQIKPIITFAPDGQLQSVAKVRGRHQVMRKLVDMAVDRCGEHKRYNLAVAHGGAPEEMKTVRQMLTEALPNSDHLWDGEIDGTLSVYIGDGVIGGGIQPAPVSVRDYISRIVEKIRCLSVVKRCYSRNGSDSCRLARLYYLSRRQTALIYVCVVLYSLKR